MLMNLFGEIVYCFEARWGLWPWICRVNQTRYHHVSHSPKYFFSVSFLCFQKPWVLFAHSQFPWNTPVSCGLLVCVWGGGGGSCVVPVDAKVIVWYLPPLFLRQGLFLNLELIVLATDSPSPPGIHNRNVVPSKWLTSSGRSFTL